MFDTLKEYKKALKRSENIFGYAIEAAKRECFEETGLITKKIRHIHTTTSGATVIWDLFYFVIDEFKKCKNGQNLENDEVVRLKWKTFEEVKQMCLSKEIKEDRTVGVLLRFLLAQPS